MELLTYGIPVWFVLAAAIVIAVFDAWANSLPMPGPNATPKEIQKFVFFNRLARNFSRAGAALRIPGAEECK
jgi:hypothetical protein